MLMRTTTSLPTPGARQCVGVAESFDDDDDDDDLVAASPACVLRRAIWDLTRAAIR